MKPEFRKVQSLMNDTSFAIVIPKEMVKKMGIGKGDSVKVEMIEERYLNTESNSYLMVTKA